MPTDALNQAIQLIQAGQPEQAQPLLEALLKANLQDLVAWSWYVKSCRTTEKRLEALEVCLKFNPGNAGVLEAIRKLQAKLSTAQPASALPPVPAAFEQNSIAPTGPEPYAFTYMAAGTASTANTIEPVDTTVHEHTGLDENSGRPFVWYDVWFKALMQPNVDSYEALLRDPLASTGRAFWWVFLATMLTGLASLIYASLAGGLSQFDQVNDGKNIGTIVAVVLVILVPVGAGLSVLGLIWGAAIYDWLARMFGGSGNFSRTVYLMAAYTAPFSLLTAIVAFIPLVNCLTIPLWGYSFWLNVVAIQTAQRLNGGRATIVVLLPSLIMIMLGCIGLLVAWPTIQSMLSSFQNLPR